MALSSQELSTTPAPSRLPPTLAGPPCPVRRAMTLIGSKWKVLLLQCLRDDRRRYGELKRMLPDISEKMLINELKELVTAGLVDEHSYPEIPPRVEYWLTHNGQQALPVLDSIVAFGKQYL
ncbi:winged helix-turn-helix transcriptional regulator [Hymenobacter negativus]|uniref:Helix-turn-helix transcriptional regulator n=1 Tax=Hymenobacter negativus TaxID=2795026 RepID=A0ABS3QBT4_9BACT|nr:helix-turn-helix domain-containing protein [Hymenobacter negativus]MBO2008632.1 helix-turn-helix transcriptional regulator [Hymenobacter negativus]